MALESKLNSSFVKRERILVLPTFESPIKTTTHDIRNNSSYSYKGNRSDHPCFLIHFLTQRLDEKRLKWWNYTFPEYLTYSMESRSIKVNLVYNQILRVLELDTENTQTPPSKLINNLFQDENCFCGGLRHHQSDTFLCIDTIDRDPSLMISLSQYSSDFIYVVNESIIFFFVPCRSLFHIIKSSNEVNKRSILVLLWVECTCYFSFSQLQFDSSILPCDMLVLISSLFGVDIISIHLIESIHTDTLCRIVSTIYSDGSHSLSRSYLWESFTKLMSLPPLSRFHILFHLFNRKVAQSELKSILRVFLWLESITYNSDSIHSMCSLSILYKP